LGGAARGSAGLWETGDWGISNVAVRVHGQERVRLDVGGHVLDIKELREKPKDAIFEEGMICREDFLRPHRLAWTEREVRAAAVRARRAAQDKQREEQAAQCTSSSHVIWN
jgi:hypothetical protein